MKRRRSSILSSLSLLLFVAVVVLWVRSYYRTHIFLPEVGGTVLPVWSANGWLGVEAAPSLLSAFYRIPYVAVALLLGGPPAIYYIRAWWRHRRASRKGLCRHCGDDLRVTPEQCPECGAVPAKAST